MHLYRSVSVTNALCLHTASIESKAMYFKFMKRGIKDWLSYIVNNGTSTADFPSIKFVELMQNCVSLSIIKGPTYIQPRFQCLLSFHPKVDERP